MTEICTEDDWYVRNIPRWVVTLSDGLTVYGDDGREGVDEPSAWIRLRSHCEANGVGIVSMRFQFRSNIVGLPSGRAGYFFARVASAVDGAPSFDGVRVGYVEADEVVTAHYKVPELTPVDYDVRRVDYTSPCVIRGAG